MYTQSHIRLSWFGALWRLWWWYIGGMARLLELMADIPLCHACHPARPPATLAGGGWRVLY
jgi:hypothetical protein